MALTVHINDVHDVLQQYSCTSVMRWFRDDQVDGSVVEPSLEDYLPQTASGPQVIE